MTASQMADARMDAKTVLALTWKPTKTTAVAVQIVQKFMAATSVYVWPDEVDFSWVADDDKKLIGIAWRLLRKAGIIDQSGEHRRSESDRAGGRVIWRYKLVSAARARTFLQRNGQVPKTNQMEFPV